MAPMSERDFDVVLFGATGFTGRLTAEHLVRAHLGEGLRLALAGRSRSKLETVRAELTRLDARAGELPLLVADAGDRGALDAIVRRARAVATTIGPFGRLGGVLLAACAAAGTHYADLTGEVPFVRRSIDQHHEEARRTGARLVHSAGFDSVPSDLGAYVALTRFRERFGAFPEQILHLVEQTRGGVSGGTVASMIEMFDDASRDRRVRGLLADPFALVDGPHPEGGADTLAPRWDPILGQWTGPFVMAAINTRIVRRSLSLLGLERDPAFARVRYDERVGTGRGSRALARAGSLSLALGGGMGALAITPVRRFAAARLLPKPGEGPSEERRERGFFVSSFAAVGAAGMVRVRLRGEGDPGYSATSRMLGEGVVSLAKDELDTPGGVRTPASTMAEPLIERLARQRIVFSTDP